MQGAGRLGKAEDQAPEQGEGRAERPPLYSPLRTGEAELLYRRRSVHMRRSDPSKPPSGRELCEDDVVIQRYGHAASVHRQRDRSNVIWCEADEHGGIAVLAAAADHPGWVGRSPRPPGAAVVGGGEKPR